MRLTTPAGTDLWLAYGMNVHPGGGVDALEAALASTVVPLRERLGVLGTMGIAIRLDAEAVFELHEDEERRRILRDLLASLELFAFTGNAFVAGDFHDVRGVKAEVYRPTWAEEARVAYTIAFADVLADLAPAGASLSLSTAPGSFRPFGEPADFDERAAVNLARVGAHLAHLHEATGRHVVLGLEPEPLCTIETTAEALAFFRGPLARATDAEPAGRAHLGVCYDVCHQAVEFEDPVENLGALAGVNVAVAKLQASCALELPDGSDARGRAVLARFDEPRWLHQTTARTRDGTVIRAKDLPDALTGERSAAFLAAGGPWRVHFHVPVHRPSAIPPLATTRPDLERALGVVARGETTAHVEVETYTWDALPPEVRAETLVESLARELEWTRGVLLDAGCRVPEDES